jgi:hypothetical protein
VSRANPGAAAAAARAAPHGGGRSDRLRVDLPVWRHRQRGDLQHPLPVDAERLAAGGEQRGTRARASHGVEEPGRAAATGVRVLTLLLDGERSPAGPGSASNTGVWVRGQPDWQDSITGAKDGRAKPIRRARLEMPLSTAGGLEGCRVSI